MNQKTKDIQIGIDLGADKIIASAIIGGMHVLIPDYQDKNAFLTPFKIIIDEEDVFVGNSAEPFIREHMELTKYMFSKPDLELETPILTDKKQINWFIEDLIGLMLKKIKIDTEAYFLEEVQSIIFAIPHSLMDNQLTPIIKAANLAGYKQLKIVDETIAAILAFDIVPADKKQKILVLDLGKTLKQTVLSIDQNSNHIISHIIKHEFGSDAFTNIISEKIIADFHKSFDSDYYFSKEEVNDIQNISEEIKIKLSSKNHATKTILINNQILEVHVSKTEFEKSCLGMIQKITDTINKELEQNELCINDIDNVVLIGGSSKIPIVQKNIQELFNFSNQQFFYNDSINAVSLGVAKLAKLNDINCFKQYDFDYQQLNKLNFNIGLKVLDTSFGKSSRDTIIQEGTLLPVNITKIYYLNSISTGTVVFEFLRYSKSHKETSIGKIIIEEIPRNETNYQIEISLDCKTDGNMLVQLLDIKTAKEIKKIFSIDHKNNIYERVESFKNLKINNL